jgi:hypothetical protein
MTATTRLITTAGRPELIRHLETLGISGLDVAQALNGMLVTVPTQDLDRVTAVLTSQGYLVSTRLDFCRLTHVPPER